MNAIWPAISGAAFAALLAVFLFALISKTKDTAEQVFRLRFAEQLKGALADWEAGFRARLREEGALPVQLSAGDFIRLSEALESKLNGRYWLASEARVAMEKLHDRISHLREEVQCAARQRDSEPRDPEIR